MKILIIDCTNTPGKDLVKYFIHNTNHEISGTWYDESELDELLKDSLIESKMELYQFRSDDPFHILDRIIDEDDYINYDYIINCRSCNNDEWVVRAIRNNSLFPNYLSERCNNKYKLIHITNNDVYLFRRSNSEYDDHDDIGLIGKTKSLGELAECMILRVSKFITEPEFKHDSWTGMTGTEFASVCNQIIENNLWKPEKYNLYSTTNDGNPDQSIWSTKDLQVKLKIKSIQKQLEELQKEKENEF